MSENSSKKPVVRPERASKSSRKAWLWVLILPVWTFGAFWLAQLVFMAFQYVLLWLKVPLDSINQVLFTTVASAIVYILAVLIVAGLPYLVWKRKTSSKDLGVPDLPTWMDYLIPVPTYIVYMICSAIFMLIMIKIFPGIDIHQAQELPFTSYMLGSRWHYLLAFLTLVVMAPVAEELLFRGYLHGKLRKIAPVWVAVLVTALTFGLAHLWAGGESLQWAVAIDTFVVGVFLSILRDYTGAIWAGMVLHAIKNGLAFYLLFVNPDLVDQIRAAILPML